MIRSLANPLPQLTSYDEGIPQPMQQPQQFGGVYQE